jgi:hypothetical protein
MDWWMYHVNAKAINDETPMARILDALEEYLTPISTQATAEQTLEILT